LGTYHNHDEVARFPRGVFIKPGIKATRVLLLQSLKLVLNSELDQFVAPIAEEVDQLGDTSG
jgi:hypothetical protein